jgi:penicillin amidase
VRVVRDRWGVPHVLAEHRLDAFRAFGHVMAGDRLWQMDLMRRLGTGRVAEVLGVPFVALDAVVRTVGLADAARAATERLTGEAAEVLDAFAAGVNAHIGSAPSGPEFELLGYAPEPWQPRDSLAVEAFVGFALALENLEPKLLLAAALGRLGVERGAWLYPRPLPSEGMDDERLAAYGALDGAVLAAFAVLGPGGGSNAWAVGGSRTATGHPLVAGDPHLLHAAPSPWYLVHLVAPDLDVAGAAYVGGPLVQVGRNRRAAWSVTNLTADDVVVVLERLDADGERYLAASGTWRPLLTHELRIGVRGEPEARPLRVRATERCRLLGDGPTAIGLRWKGVTAPGHSLGGWLAVMGSRGADDVLRAAPAFDGAPFQTNLIYGDADGRLLHLAVGAVPRRRGGLGFLPALGWRGEGAWDGIGSLGARPWRVDPPEAAVWTANEATGAADAAAGGDGQPYAEHPYRARRIRDVLLGGRAHTPERFARLQVDDLDLAAVGNLPALRDALGDWEPADAVVARARDLLCRWDGRAAADAPAAAIYHVLFFAEWMPFLFPEATCPGFAARWRVASWGAEAILRAPQSPWFPQIAAKHEALRACAGRAVARLRARAGDDPGAWRWDDLHAASFVHPLAFAPRLAKGALASVPLGGSPFTVNQQRLGAALPPFGAVVGAGVRMVADLGDPGHLRIVLSTGQSGDPESPHFADHQPAWRAGEVFCIPLDSDRVRVEGEQLLEPHPGA